MVKIAIVITSSVALSCLWYWVMMKVDLWSWRRQCEIIKRDAEEARRAAFELIDSYRIRSFAEVDEAQAGMEQVFKAVERIAYGKNGQQTYH